MKLNRHLFLILIFLILYSCSSESIIRSNRKYFAESNIFERKDKNIILSQKVRFNNVKNGLHSSWHELTIDLLDVSNLKTNQILDVKIDSTKVKVNYNFSSNRNLGVNTDSIEGTIRIIKITNEKINIKENLCVSSDGKRMNYNGIRVFKNDDDGLSRMKRNRIIYKEDTCNDFFELSFLLWSAPDNAWVLEFKKNGTYKYYQWSGWGSDTILEKGDYSILNNLITLKSDSKKKALSKNYILKTFKGKICKNEYQCKCDNNTKNCFKCSVKDDVTYCLYDK